MQLPGRPTFATPTHLLNRQPQTLVQRRTSFKGLQRFGEFRVTVRHGLVKVLVLDGDSDGLSLGNSLEQGLSSDLVLADSDHVRRSVRGGR
jgi:hypothetical protein